MVRGNSVQTTHDDRKSRRGKAGVRLARRWAAAILVAGLPAARAAEEVVELDEMTISSQALAEALSANTLDAVGLASEQSRGNDTAGLFKDIPGVSLNTGGGVSSLPAVHGLADDRVKVVVNGMNISSACSNHMNPALSYVAPQAVGKATVMAGITPVSQGGDSVGGTISVDPLAPEFATAEQKSIQSARFGSFYRSVNDNFGSSAAASYATEDWRTEFNASWAKALSYRAGDDGPRVIPSEFETSNGSLRGAVKTASGLWSADLSGQHLPYQGFPNQRMDMTRNDAILGGINYDNSFGWGDLDGKVYYHETWHKMDSLPSRLSAPMPMLSNGSDLGYRVRAHVHLEERHTLHVGNEFFRQTLDDWWPGQNIYPQDFLSINDGHRNRMGTFAEWQADWDEDWTSLVGFRNDTLWTDTGQVQGYSNDPISDYWSTGFNAANRARTFVNFDVTALGAWTPDKISRYELGFARKQRAPNLYELYAWSGAAQKSMINWFGDGNGYQGNLDLESETAYNFSFTASWKEPDQGLWSASISPYYTYMTDYIWGRVQSIGRDGFRGMQFVNIPEARLYGIDASGRYAFLPESPAGSFALKASLAYVRGEGRDGGRGMPCPYPGAFPGGEFVCAAEGWPLEGVQAPENVNLYHIMPIHGTLALEHAIETSYGSFSNYMGVDLVNAKTVVAETYNEPKTPGYVLLNLRTSYQYKQFKLDLGVDNLLDKDYFHPLGGVYIYATRFPYNPAALPRVPAMGRSVFVSFNLEF
jgi:iron complex outermembrane receptor protein